MIGTIPNIIKELYYDSNPAYAGLHKVNLSLIWRGIPVQIHAGNETAKRQYVLFSNSFRKDVQNSPMISVKALDGSKPFEFRPDAEAVSRGAAEVVYKRIGEVNIFDLEIKCEFHLLDEYGRFIYERALIYMQARTRPECLSEILCAFTSGSYEPLYLDYMKMIAERRGSGLNNVSGTEIYWRGDLIDAPYPFDYR